MGMLKAMLKSRKGLDFWDIFFYLFYFLVAFVIIFLLNLAGCVVKDKEARAGIGADVSLAAVIRADAQLDSYLRTQMPGKEELLEKLGWLEKNKDVKYIKSLIKELDIDFGKVEDFLNKHPEVYAGRDYSGFISSLHPFYFSGNENDKEDAKKVFKAVTAAMFIRAVIDYPKKGDYLFYLLPLGADFDPSDLSPSRKEDMCKESYELCARYLPPEVVPSLEDPLIYVSPIRFSSQAIQVIPLADAALAKVEFRYYPEFTSRLPQP